MQAWGPAGLAALRAMPAAEIVARYYRPQASTRDEPSPVEVLHKWNHDAAKRGRMPQGPGWLWDTKDKGT